MKTPSALRLLAADNNERGDLFERLARDLFFALGYDNLRCDVQKSGRELDIQGEHRLEPRRVLGECKAYAAKVGGEDLNKFLGVLTRERKVHSPRPVAGYFVSLGGFTETGIEQEVETGDDRVILLDAAKAIAELERSHVIVGRTEAAERAGRCVQNATLCGASLDGAELLAHECGYIWALFFASGKRRSHVALIHADGTPLARAVAREVISAERSCGGGLHSLTYLAPAASGPDRTALLRCARARYRAWLAEECGYVQLAGLPADTNLSATRLRLERLFVPLKAVVLSEPHDHAEAERAARSAPERIGEILETNRHLALLATPGGGKSTLLKRLAIAYAFPERRAEVADALPEMNWFPLILRCRELRDRAHRPILELLDDIPRHAGMSNAECVAFTDFIHGTFRSGKALLLVDGLDEISDEGARQTFAEHLRTLVATFPEIALVLTSRKAGFRLVASVVAGSCQQAELAPLDQDDVLLLCERWHVAAVGDSDAVRREARTLGQTIWDNDRIRSLAENPLLLTTLLVVKRWVRELPRSRAELYREAIRVLVRTWNVEGYEPLDESEALAQLSYVACAMMRDGKQQIGQGALLDLLQSARRELEPELQFARISAQEFIERIEYRSSLLMQVGHGKTDGTLEPVYEFRHLTFQEYLAARGYVEEQYPGRDEGRSLADLLRQHFSNERWHEAISLAAILAGRRSEEMVKQLTAACRRRRLQERRQQKAPSRRMRSHAPASLLIQCIRDEVILTPATLRAALSELGRTRDPWSSETDWVGAVARGKFGSLFGDLTERSYIAGGPDMEDSMGVLAELSWHSFFGQESQKMSASVATRLQEGLKADDRLTRIRSALVCMGLAFRSSTIGSGTAPRRAVQERYERLLVGLGEMLGTNDIPCALAASWALAWMGEHRLMADPPRPEILVSLYGLWRSLESAEQARYAGWALAAQPLLPRDTFGSDVWGDCDDFLRRAVGSDLPVGPGFAECACVVGWYRRAPWTDDQLSSQVERLNPYVLTMQDLQRRLRDAG